MIMGIGTDIFSIHRIRGLQDFANDPFYLKAYTEKERLQAAERGDPTQYFATRFAGKEAVFKSLGIENEEIRLNEIEILSSEHGAPSVTLHGGVLEIAKRRGVSYVTISLSFETEYALAFAVAIS